MASNDEYQHLRFWEDEPVVIRCYVVEQDVCVKEEKIEFVSGTLYNSKWFGEIKQK